MTPVLQTRYGKGQGNCLTACVASVLDVSIETLPEFCVDGEWFGRLYDFCMRNGFALLYWKHSDNVPVLAFGAYVILLLELEGEEELHAVVGKTVLDKKVFVTEDEIRRDPNLKPGDVCWEWKTELVHDPNQNTYPPVKRPTGYILISRT